MALRTLDIDNRSIQGDPSNVDILIGLSGTDSLRPNTVGNTTGSFVDTAMPVTGKTDKDGNFSVQIAATDDYVNKSQYTVRIGRRKPILFKMPDADANLYDIVHGTAPPVTPSVLPVLAEVGEGYVQKSDGLGSGVFIHSGSSPPNNPSPYAFWEDTSVTPSDLRYSNNGGMTWNEVLDPDFIVALLNSRHGDDRVDGAHIKGQVTPAFGVDAPSSTTGFRPYSLYIHQPRGQTATASLYILTGDARVGLTNRNRLQVTLASNAIQTNTDNYEVNSNRFLNSISIDATHRRLFLRFDTGVVSTIPDQLWMTGLESTGISTLTLDPDRPYIDSGGRRLKQFRVQMSASALSGINSAQTWLLFTDLGATEAYDFKPAVQSIPGEWVEIQGGMGGGGLSRSQINALIATWARTTSPSGIIPDARLATGTANRYEVPMRGATANSRTWGLIDESNLLDAAVGGAKIADLGVEAGKYAEQSIDWDDINPTLRLAFVPGSGTTNQVLSKTSNANYAVTWRTIREIPTGGTNNQYLRRTSTGYAWTNFPSIPGNTEIDARIKTFARTGGRSIQAGDIGTNQVTLTKLSTAVQGRLIPTGGSDGQYLQRTSTGYRWNTVTSGGGGLTTQQATALIHTWARASDSATRVPTSKGGVLSGGLNGQVYRRTASGYEWASVSTGSGTPLSVTPVESRVTPSLASTALTVGTEVQLNLTADSLASAHPFSVASNTITVAAGTSPLLSHINVVLGIDPTAWTNSANAGGNRLFMKIILKKNGTTIYAGTVDRYIRGDERYAPNVHQVEFTTSEILTASDALTLFVEKIGTQAAGNEINSIAIVGTDSSFKINSEAYSGGNVMQGGGGLTQTQVDTRADARITAGVKVFARTGQRNIQAGDIDNNAITQGKINDGAVSLAKLASAVQGRLLPTGGSNNQYLRRTSTGYAWNNFPSIPGNTEIDARIKVYARAGGRLIQTGDIGTGQITSTNIADATIVSGDIAANSITGANIAPNTITLNKLNSNVTSRLVITGGSNNQVYKRTSTGYSWGLVNVNNLATLSVNESKMLSSAVSSRVLANNAVITAKIANSAVTLAKLASDVTGRLVPTGGTAGQVLTWPQSGSTPTWEDATGGSGGSSTFTGLTDTPSALGAVGQAYRVNAGRTALEAYTPSTATDLAVTPIVTGTTLSLAATNNNFRTTGTDMQLAMAINAGNTTQGSAYGSNMLEISSVVTAFLGHIQVNAAVSVQDYSSSSTSGGNRLFFEIQLKRNGTVISTSRNSTYYRARSGWAPPQWWANVTYTGIMNPSDRFTVHIVRTSPFGAGSEADDIAITSGNIQLASQHFTGGSVQIVRGSKRDVVPYRNYADAPSTTTDASQGEELPSTATQYDDLLVVAQATTNINDSTVYFNVPVDRFDGRVGSAWVRVHRLNQPDWTSTNNRQLDLQVILQSGVYSVRAVSNQAGSTFRPRILMVRLTSWAGID